MKPEEQIKEILEDIKYFSDLLDDRVSELHKVNGMQQCRHAYIFYRTLLWNIRDKINELNIKSIK